MILMKKILGAAALSLCVAQPVAAQTLTVDDSFATHVINWQGSNGIVVRTRPVVQDGVVYICGIYTYSGGPKYAKLAKAVLKESKIKIAGNIVFRNLNFFSSDSPRHYASRLDGRAANCRNPTTPINVDDIDTFEFEIRSGSYRVRG
jgi:hypothetical protein